MSAFKTGDLIFLQETSLPPVGNAQCPIAVGIYLREATNAECTTAGVTEPASWYAGLNGAYFMAGTVASGFPIGPVPDSIIIGAIHTGIDQNLLAI